MVRNQIAAALMARAQRVGLSAHHQGSAAAGKGMQVVNSAAEFAAAVESAQRLARTAFGDDRCCGGYFPGRHVEVQISPTRTGTVSLFDRDCSVQRAIKDSRGAPGTGAARCGARGDVAGRIQARAAVGLCGSRAVSSWSRSQNFYFME